MTQQEFTARYSYNPKSDQLGSGGFGSVYKAYDNEEDCFVALKIAAVDLQHPELRLRNEVAKAEHLKHKNVARYDACYTFPTFSGEMDIAVMRYYEHGSLDRFMRRGDLTLDERYDILMQILEGIAYLHSHGIIHRDLKPQNVLIVHHADKYIPKITDFGISKQLEDGESSLVSNSVLGGTRSYASPEQLCERTLRKNTDLWSFGVIAYYMLLGELPFTTGTFSASSDEGRSEQLRQVLSGKLPEGINHISEPWQSVIRGCLVVDGEKRLQHAEDCLEIINRGVTPEVDVEVEPVGDEKTVIGVSAQEADEKTTTDDEKTKIVTPQPTPQPKVELPKLKTPIEPAPKQKRSRWWLWLLGLLLIGGVAYLMFKGDDKPIPEPQPTSNKDFTVRVGDVSFKMIWVEGGSYWMGSPNGVGYNDERPQHKVTLDGYWIAETEVTQGLWRAVMNGKDEGWTTEYGKGSDYPAYYVSYTEAIDFCKELNAKTNYKYNFTLPTEAQWEYAARGGNKSNGYTYSGSNTLDNVAWYSGNSNSKTHVVKTKASNELGIYDMSGNVWEWCSDWYGENYYKESPEKNPKGPSTGVYRVLRGGGWDYSAESCRVANRLNFNPDYSYSYYGFRLVVSSSL